MAAKTQSAAPTHATPFQPIATGIQNGDTTGQQYWWNTSGTDLSRMLREADYPEATQRAFLTFYQDVLCPLLGAPPSSTSVKSGVGRDGNPFEYSFELKDTSKKKKTVRFVIDVTQLRPPDQDHPLSIASAQKVVDFLAKRTPGFDDAWYRALFSTFLHHERHSHEQQEIVRKAGYQTPLILGFDIHRELSSPDALPVMAKVYFPPCFTAAAENITRWDVVKRGVHSLPQISTYPNILKALGMIESYISHKGAEYKDGTRYLATDFIAPGKARLKIYFRDPSESFDAIWDYYTLGGSIPHLDEDKEKFRDLFNFTAGLQQGQVMHEDDAEGRKEYTAVRRKATALYFSLSPDNQYPAPKICFYPSNFARDDAVVADGLQRWMERYSWATQSETSIGDRVRKVLCVISLPTSANEN